MFYLRGGAHGFQREYVLTLTDQDNSSVIQFEGMKKGAILWHWSVHAGKLVLDNRKSGNARKTVTVDKKPAPLGLLTWYDQSEGTFVETKFTKVR